MIIETQRLLLREMTEDDFDALHRVLTDADIMQHYSYSFDKERVKQWINKNTTQQHRLMHSRLCPCLCSVPHDNVWKSQFT